ncbi:MULTISPECIES: hypothetical protein [Methylobacterium]|uniref:hypothetical protein n=1 Tax=Methylobacterium TaxID=407 RepID=UPI0010509E50|nr:MULTISPECIES: hypothetical protein [Methylobacterium]MDR7036671.1 hypothetical protein [Methylobacterium sp. BE186]
MSIQVQPVRVETDSSDEAGELVFADGRLVAVLVQLSDEHEAEAGMWFLEAGFGRLQTPDAPKFADLDEARAWIEQRLAPPS